MVTSATRRSRWPYDVPRLTTAAIGAKNGVWCPSRSAATNQATPAASAHCAICQRFARSARATRLPRPTGRTRAPSQLLSSGCARPCDTILGGPTRMHRAWSRPSIRRQRDSCSPRTARSRCTSAGCSCSRSPRARGAATCARCTSRCARTTPPTRSRRCSSSTRTGRCARRGSSSGRSTSSSTSTTTSGTARCRSPGACASSSTWCRGCTAPASPGSGPLWEAHLIEGLRDGRVAMLHQDPPRPRRRCLRDAAAGQRDRAPTPTSAACPHRGRCDRRPGRRRNRPRRRAPRPSGAAATCRRRPSGPRSASPPRPPACPAR